MGTSADGGEAGASDGPTRTGTKPAATGKGAGGGEALCARTLAENVAGLSLCSRQYAACESPPACQASM